MQSSTEEETKETTMQPLPLKYNARVIEMEQSIQAEALSNRSQDYEFLGHLPPATSYLTVEVNLTNGCDRPI